MGDDGFIPKYIGDYGSEILHVYKPEMAQCHEIGKMEKKVYFDDPVTAGAKGFKKLCEDCLRRSEAWFIQKRRFSPDLGVRQNRPNDLERR